MKKVTIYLSVIFYFFIANQLFGQWSILDTEDKAEEPFYLQQKFSKERWNASNFASEKDLEWFKDAKYGMFIHFGLATYIGKDLSWGMCYTRKLPDSGHGGIADSIWKTYPNYFLLEKFNAKEWVDIAKKAGMKYIVTIAKHHDGFHLWDTKFSDFKITNTPFKRDYLKEIADACHAAGMKFGIYYSQRDWYHPDYAPVDSNFIEPYNDAPYYKVKPNAPKNIQGKTHSKYIDYQYNAIKELCTNYGKVDVFWFDACWWGGMFTEEMWDSEKLTRLIRKLQPGIIINNRASIPGDFDTPEQKIGMYQARPWESCLTLCGTWSWSPTPNKSKKDLIRLITSSAIGNGNSLVSWGPKWDGGFATDQISLLKSVGDWMKINGKAIYNTKGGPWLPNKLGGSTYNGKEVFVHLFDLNGSKTIELPAIDNKLLKINVLNSKKKINFDQNSQRIELDLSSIQMDSISTILELTFQNPIKIEGINEKAKIKLDTLTYFDKARNRPVPVAIYTSNLQHFRTASKLVLINHGYNQNNLGANLSYSYIAEKLASEGFYVVSIQNELPTDALLPMDGDIKKGRYPFWEQGVENNLFVIKELRKNNPNLNVDDLLIIGHSNGGDIAALFGNKYPDLVKKIITLDNRRMKLPTNQVKVLSLRSADFAADEGVLPTKEDEKKFNMKIKFTKVKHNEMSDSGSDADKQDIINQIMRFLK